jgi:hypothetical protein
MQPRQDGRSGNVSVSLDRATQRRILEQQKDACAIHYNRRRTRLEFAASALRRRLAVDLGTRGAQYRSDAPYDHYPVCKRRCLRCSLILVDWHSTRAGRTIRSRKFSTASASSGRSPRSSGSSIRYSSDGRALNRSNGGHLCRTRSLNRLCSNSAAPTTTRSRLCQRIDLRAAQKHRQQPQPAPRALAEGLHPRRRGGTCFRCQHETCFTPR